MAGIYTTHDEIVLKAQLDALFAKWQKLIPTNAQNIFITDGFFPGYLSQKVKVLFIGRESLGMDCDYIEGLLKAYKKGVVGEKSLDAYQFHYLLFYIAYGFNNNFCTWDNIPQATKLAQGMGKDGVSFAFMNASKLSNWGDWQLDPNLSNASLNISQNGKLLQEEIDILRPDVICSLNALGMIGKQINSYERCKELSLPDISVNDYKLSDGTIVPILDMWHFSAPSKSPKLNYYEPLCAIASKLAIRYPTLMGKIK